MEQKNKIELNTPMTIAAVAVCAIVGVLFWLFKFDTTNLVCTEVVLIPATVLLMGVRIGSGRLSALIKTTASLVLAVALAANLLMGIFNATPAVYGIIDGLILVVLFVTTYQLTRLNQ